MAELKYELVAILSLIIGFVAIMGWIKNKLNIFF